ncbi:hypothetical protein pb186bvf_012438 [Paramecium bursaria]
MKNKQMKSKHNYPINDPISYDLPTLESLKKQYVGLAEVNQNAQIKENGIFLILRSASLDNIHKGMKYGLWTSTPKSNQKIDNLFKSNDNVYLLYTVVGSKSFQAVAKLQSGFRTESFKYWDEPLKWFGSFEIKCLYLGELKQKTLDEKQQADLGQIVLTDQTDCTEINSNLGKFVIQCFKDLLAEPDYKNPFVHQFPNMDSREQAIKDSRTEDFEQQFEQQQKIFEKSPFEYRTNIGNNIAQIDAKICRLDIIQMIAHNLDENALSIVLYIL